jgi:hypothetical protein
VSGGNQTLVCWLNFLTAIHLGSLESFPAPAHNFASETRHELSDDKSPELGQQTDSKSMLARCNRFKRRFVTSRTGEAALQIRKQSGIIDTKRQMCLSAANTIRRHVVEAHSSLKQKFSLIFCVVVCQVS